MRDDCDYTLLMVVFAILAFAISAIWGDPSLRFECGLCDSMVLSFG